MDSLTFAMEIHTLQTHLGIKLIERTPIAHSLAGKNALSIEDLEGISYYKTIYSSKHTHYCSTMW